MAGNGNGTPLIYMENITRRFGLIAALQDVNFTVERGEIVGLLGDNGAGKSTLIKVLTGVHTPSEGQIYFEGQPVRIPSPKVARQLGIETVYQDLALVNLMSIARNFYLGRAPLRRLGPIKLLDKDRMNRETVEALAEIGIEIRRPEEEVLRLSGGERQSIAIGRAAFFGQKLLILDEPTSALSVGETKKVLSYTHEAKRKGMGVIFITHNIGHVYQVADRFTIISHGHKVGDFMKDEVSQEEISLMIMGGPIPERLVPVIEERETRIRSLHESMVTASAPEALARRQRERRRNGLVGGAIAFVAVILLLLAISGGAFSTIQPTATPLPSPTIDMASIPDDVLALQDQVLNNPDSGQRAIAASKLGAPKYQHASSVDVLIQALSDSAWEVQAAAAKSLGRLGDRRAIDPLQALLRSDYSPVRDAASETLQAAFGLSCSASNGCN